FTPGPWKEAKATFYGAPDGSGTIGGACGYEDDMRDAFGVRTAALSAALFKDAQACGSCYEIRCAQGNDGCRQPAETVQVTATNLCPSGGWCSYPNEHFDMSQPAFLQIAKYEAGVVPVQYRRVPCKKNGGIRFKITGNPNFNLVTITNVGGAGDVTKVEVRTVDLPWTELKRNWGEKWEIDSQLLGRRLTFRITTSDGGRLTLRRVAPVNWQFGQTYETRNY
ncbi:hypothetical protein M569_07876, partial [Genlisea aurea]